MAKSVENPNVVILGDVCIDRNRTEKGVTYTGWGGPGPYGQRAAKLLGIEEVVIAATYGDDFRLYADDFHIVTPPSPGMHSLTYRNVTTANGREQTCHNSENAILPKLTENLRALIRQADILMVAPLTPNYTMTGVKEVAELADKNHAITVLCPQGYFRQIHRDGSISSRPFREAALLMPSFDLTILSEADTPNAVDQAESWALSSLRTRVVVTEAEKGAKVISASGAHRQVPTVPIASEDITDSVGCGDFFAMATAIEYWRSGDIDRAVANAHETAGKKLTGILATS